MAFLIVQEVLPPTLDSTSQPPSLFDGTTRLYINYQCACSKHVWITRNVKEVNKLDGYKQTKVLEHEKMVEYYKNRFLPKV